MENQAEKDFLTLFKEKPYRLFAPGQLTKIMRNYSFVNLKYISLRREKGVLIPELKAQGQGFKNQYDLQMAFIFCIAVEFEAMGFSIDDAYKFSNEIVKLNLWQSDNLWLIIFYGEDDSHELSIFKQSKNDQKIDRNEFENGDTYKNEMYIFLSPMPGKFFQFHKFEVNNMEKFLGTIKAIKYINVDDMISDCRKRLELTEYELEYFKIKSLIELKNKTTGQLTHRQ